MTDIPTTPEAAREQQARWQERLEAGTCDCPTLAHDHANLLGAYAEMLERERAKAAIWEERRKRLEDINRYVAEQAMRNIGREYHDIMRAIDFVLKMPTYNPSDGHLLSVAESLHYAAQLTSAKERTSGTDRFAIPTRAR